MFYLSKILLFFSVYAHPFEKRIDKFLQTLNWHSSKAVTEKKLLELMQENTAILTLWLEKRTKNYRHLSKNYRQQKYANLQVVENLFKQYQSKNIILDVKNFPVNLNNNTALNQSKLKYLWQIMNFCKEHFIYQINSSFDKLLVPVPLEKMVGDCNQICTLYIHLYSLKYPVNDLKIKLFTDHVALQFDNIDIEATSCSFVKHHRDGQILPISEIVATNMLDIPDFREKQWEIPANNFFKNAQLAFLLSSLSSVVQHNLDIALQKLAISLVKQDKFKPAIVLCKKITNKDMVKSTVKVIYSQAVQFYNKKNNFKQARYFAKQSLDKKFAEELILNISKHEYAYNIALVKDITTIKEAKKFKKIYQKLLFLGKEMKEKDLEKWAQTMLEKINK